MPAKKCDNEGVYATVTVRIRATESETMAVSDQKSNEPKRRVDPRLLEILACPITKTPLRYDADKQELISDKAGLAFPIREGIPIMLVDEARKLAD